MLSVVGQASVFKSWDLSLREEGSQDLIAKARREYAMRHETQGLARAEAEEVACDLAASSQLKVMEQMGARSQGKADAAIVEERVDNSWSLGTATRVAGLGLWLLLIVVPESSQ